MTARHFRVGEVVESCHPLFGKGYWFPYKLERIYKDEDSSSGWMVEARPVSLACLHKHYADLSMAAIRGEVAPELVLDNACGAPLSLSTDWIRKTAVDKLVPE